MRLKNSPADHLIMHMEHLESGTQKPVENALLVQVIYECRRVLITIPLRQKIKGGQIQIPDLADQNSVGLTCKIKRNVGLGWNDIDIHSPNDFF